MRAMIRDRYGPPDVLHPGEVAPPALADDAVLVRVRASSVNAHDWHMLRGKPYFARLQEGVRVPRQRVLGLDVAGTVEGVGSAVAGVRLGDRVFGSRWGAWAEMVAGRHLVRMPDGLGFDAAAAIPTAGQTALQGLRDKGSLRSGERVLIIGAGGGVGTMAVQIARALGGIVTAATSPRNADLVAGLGAEDVIGHGRADLERQAGRFDLVLDVGGRHGMAVLRRTLTPSGRVVMVAPAPGDWLGPLPRIAGAYLTDRLGRRPVLPFLSSVRRDDIATLGRMVEAGELRPVIDRVMPFDDIPEAVRIVESGRASGKVVIAIP